MACNTIAFTLPNRAKMRVYKLSRLRIMILNNNVETNSDYVTQKSSQYKAIYKIIGRQLVPRLFDEPCVNCLPGQLPSE